MSLERNACEPPQDDYDKNMKELDQLLKEMKVGSH